MGARARRTAPFSFSAREEAQRGGAVGALPPPRRRMGGASCLGGLVGVAQERERADGGSTPACSRPGCPLGRAGADRDARVVGPCVYHPQKPQFRDGWKVWPCCGRGTRDWEALMAIPGCAEAPECVPEGAGGVGWEADCVSTSEGVSPATAMPLPSPGGGERAERPESRPSRTLKCIKEPR